MLLVPVAGQGPLGAEFQHHQIPGHMVQAVDATGAGDCFAGNLLARLSAGDDLWAATAYANAAAALSVQGYGAVAPLPTREAVLEMLHTPSKGTLA